MIHVEIPGFKSLSLDHLILDMNGTLARDGVLIGGVMERLQALLKVLEIHVVTADTFGTVKKQLQGEAFDVVLLGPENQAQGKADIAEGLGLECCVAIGNGRNDKLMLERCALGIAVMETEGAALEALAAADVIVGDIRDGLDLLTNTKRLIATLRS